MDPHGMRGYPDPGNMYKRPRTEGYGPPMGMDPYGAPAGYGPPMGMDPAGYGAPYGGSLFPCIKLRGLPFDVSDDDIRMFLVRESACQPTWVDLGVGKGVLRSQSQL